MQWSVGFNRIIISVPELAAAMRDYSVLLGAKAHPVEAADGAPAAWLGMSNTVIELCERPAQRPGVAAVVFTGSTALEPVDNPLGLELYRESPERVASFRDTAPRAQVRDFKVDHLVLRTRDAEACISCFRDQLGLRLALDQTVPAWGGRMLFFRSGGLTLEVIAAEEKKPSRNYFWGIAYQCPDIEVAANALKAAQVAVSEVREGRKTGTRVATLKSHTLELPTLLIEPAAT